MNNPRTLTAAAACTLMLVTACGGGEKVGDGVDTTVKPGASGGLFPTTAPPATKKATKPPVVRPSATRPPVRATTKPPATKAPPPQQTPEQIITINGDKSGKSLLDPPRVRVLPGYRVTWKNADTKPHGVVSQDGRINSGPCSPQNGITSTCIQPGKSYTWIAGPRGKYAYKDSSRPYATAEIEVL